MACCGRLTRALRFDRHVCAIDSEAGSGGPGALARMTKLPADDTASPTRKMSSLQPVMLPLSMTELCRLGDSRASACHSYQGFT
jgi:hypothetical protein